MKRSVIDFKAEVPNKVFPIGHSGAQSETFFPGFHRIDNDTFYVDIAGLSDSGGDLIEFTNQFINKYLFSKADQIKFLIPIS